MTPTEYLQEQVEALKSDVKRLYDEIIMLKNLIQNTNKHEQEIEKKEGVWYV